MNRLRYRWLRLCARMVGADAAYVARGWAVGMFYGCLIPFGFQLVLSIPTAVALRGSRVGATLGTLITNHFTIFFIYPAQCWAGNAVLRLFGFGTKSVDEIVRLLMDVGSRSMFTSDFWQGAAGLGVGVFAPFFVGGALLAAVCTPLTYFGVLRFARRRALRRAQRRERFRRAR